MRTLRVAMIGCGTVGCGVVRLLQEQRDLLLARSGAAFDLAYVVVRDPGKPRPVELPAATRVLTDPAVALADPDVDVVIEVMGGVDRAYEVIAAALRAGKHVVTANKAVLAERGSELFRLAREHQRAIRFEAAVAGGIPILDAVSSGLAANQIERLSAILNGTSNYILSAMADEGWDYAAALKKAQELGFAEADPTLDVNGTDTAQKLAILARLAFHSVIDCRAIATTGIDQLDAADIAYASELKYAIKLLAVAQVREEEPRRLCLRVAPMLVHRHRPLAQVRGENNAIHLHGHATGGVFFAGKGAGMLPTASSVVANLVELAIGRGQQTFQALGLWEERTPGPPFDPQASIRSRFYLRFAIIDRPGTLAQIAGVLGRHGISIASVIQREASEDEIGEPVPLIIMTHACEEATIRTALAEADQLPILHRPTLCLHVAD